MLGPVRPGKTAVMAIAVTAPTEPGNYKLQLDLVQENVSWFETRGAPVLMVPVVVKADTDTPKPRGSRG